MKSVNTKMFGTGTLVIILTMPLPSFGYEGFLEPIETVDIASSETGILQSVKVKEGDQVAKGDVVAVIDFRLIGASLKVAKAKKDSQASILAAKAEWESAKQKLAEFKRLHAAGNARRDELNKAELEESVASTQVTRAQEQQLVAELEYKRIQAQINQNHIRSPIDGEIVTVNRDSGELVSASQGPFIRVVNIEKLKFVTNIPSAEASNLSEGASVKLVVDEGNQELEAVVEYLSEVIDPTSGTAKVTLVIDQPNDARSGLAGKMVLE